MSDQKIISLFDVIGDGVNPVVDVEPPEPPLPAPEPKQPVINIKSEPKTDSLPSKPEEKVDIDKMRDDLI